MHDKVYVAFARSDGDGINFQRHYYRKLFDDKSHGVVPVSWQIGANAADLNPAIVDYYYKHAGPGDYFLNALTGVGYIYEDEYADNYPAARREQIWNEYLKISTAYRARIDSSVLVTFAEMQPQRLERFASIPGVDGVFANYGTSAITSIANELTESAGKPVFRAIGIGADINADYTFTTRERRSAELSLIDEVRRFTPQKRPAFMHVFLGNWLSDMEMVANIATGLGPDYIPVRADHLIALYKQSRA